MKFLLNLSKGRRDPNEVLEARKRNPATTKQKFKDKNARRKTKFDNPKQKHHYVHAVRHYKAMKDAGFKKDFDSANKHAMLAKKHLDEGKVRPDHRDSFQHASRHSEPATTTKFTPYKKTKGRSTFVKSVKFFVRW